MIYFSNLVQYKNNCFYSRKLFTLVYFILKALRFILFMYKPLKFYKNTPKLFQNYILTLKFYIKSLINFL
jgi:hypothetical protein